MSVLALDLGGTKLASAVFSSRGRIVGSAAIPLDKRKGEDVGELIVDEIRRCQDSAEEQIESIGVSIPGIYRHRTGTVWAPNIGGWEDFPLHQVIQKMYPGLPVAIDNDRACSMFGEQWRGNAQGCSDAVFLAVGTGIGAGILSGGHILRGAGDIGGAAGWMALKMPFHEKYALCGCFEYYASGAGLARLATELMNDDSGYGGVLRQHHHLVAHHVFEAHALGDPVARKVFAECVCMWGMAAANFVSLFNPEKLIFGGGLFGPATRFIPSIYEEALKWAQPISIHQVSFEASALGTQAAIYGAAQIAFQRINKSVRP
ncbi:MAG TPA: ROK family protein [Chryseolinea sp.]|nr:ROK family protein [Chryseolinea sp.]